LPRVVVVEMLKTAFRKRPCHLELDSSKALVIFGGSGFIGGAVATFLRAKYHVTVADIRPPAESNGVSFIQCDVREKAQVDEALKKASVALYLSIVQIPEINAERLLGYEVNVLGLENVCKGILGSPTAKGMVLAGTWRIFGDKALAGRVDEGFGSRPDAALETARVYVMSKVIQESVVRYYDEMAIGTGKVFGVLRLGTVLGVGMSDVHVSSHFVEEGVHGRALRPYRHSMHRPILYVDIEDVCKGFAAFINSIVTGEGGHNVGSLAHVANLFWPEPVSVLDLAKLIKDEVRRQTSRKISPRITLEDKDLPVDYAESDKRAFHVDSSRSMRFLGLNSLVTPKESVGKLVARSLSDQGVSKR